MLWQANEINVYFNFQVSYHKREQRKKEMKYSGKLVKYSCFHCIIHSVCTMVTTVHIFYIAVVKKNKKKGKHNFIIPSTLIIYDNIFQPNLRRIPQSIIFFYFVNSFFEILFLLLFLLELFNFFPNIYSFFFFIHIFCFQSNK
jgi:hypothetical protein